MSCSILGHGHGVAQSLRKSGTGPGVHACERARRPDLAQEPKVCLLNLRAGRLPAGSHKDAQSCQGLPDFSVAGCGCCSLPPVTRSGREASSKMSDAA